MLQKTIYKLQHTFNLEVFKKHFKRLFPDFKEVDNPKEPMITLEEAGNKIYDHLDLTAHLTKRSKNSLMYAVAMQMEISELIAALGFKWWSTKTENWVNVKESAEYKHLLEEYVDIGHFFMSLGHALGFTAEQIQEAYKIKLDENYSRQERGY